MLSSRRILRGWAGTRVVPLRARHLSQPVRSNFHGIPQERAAVESPGSQAEQGKDQEKGGAGDEERKQDAFDEEADDGGGGSGGRSGKSSQGGKDGKRSLKGVLCAARGLKRVESLATLRGNIERQLQVRTSLYLPAAVGEIQIPSPVLRRFLGECLCRGGKAAEFPGGTASRRKKRVRAASQSHLPIALGKIWAPG